MKKVIIIGMVLILTLGLIACSPQKAIEKAIMNQMGVDVSSDGDTYTIKGEDGDSSISVGDNQKWPKDKMGELPELKCKVLSTVSTNDGAVVIFDEVSKADAKSYVEKLKSLGYDNDIWEMEGEEMLTFTGSNGDIVVSFSWVPNDNGKSGTGNVGYTKN